MQNPSTRTIATRASLPSSLLALAVLGAAALLIVPLPTVLLDLLWACLLAASLTMAMVSLGVNQVARVSAFPSLLVLSTLLRLALTLATARAILQGGNAGALVSGMGSLLMGNNPWIGWVLFIALTVTQLVVVVRGNERVAEVRARFALDAMPGKQLSIDADLRGGAIQPADAQRLRHALSAEGELLGALDGATKFARGEQVALVLVVLLIVAGGVTAGVFERHLPLAEAFRHFSVLAIGVGLLAQLSAFAFAAASGIFLIRADISHAGVSLGDQLASLLGASPIALKLTAVALLFLAFFPGIPAIPLTIIAGTLLLITHWQKSATPLAASGSSSSIDTTSSTLHSVLPWSITVSTDLAPLTKANLSLTPNPPALQRMLDQLRSDVQHTLGVPLPAGLLQIDSQLPPRHCVLSLREIPAHRILINEPAGSPAELDEVTLQFARVMRRHAAELLGVAETQTLLDHLDASAKATALQVIPKMVNIPNLCEVLRNLLAEGISIRDMKAILEALAHNPANESDPTMLTEIVRSQLRRAITQQFAANSDQIVVLPIEPGLEDLLRGAVVRSKGSQVLGLAPAAARDFVRAAQRALELAHSADPGAVPVVLAAPDVRRFVRELLAVDFPDLPVIAPTELVPTIGLKPLATITVQGL